MSGSTGDTSAGVIADPAHIPGWLRPLTDNLVAVGRHAENRSGDRTRFVDGLRRSRRRAAVLVLFSGPDTPGADAADPDAPGPVAADARDDESGAAGRHTPPADAAVLLTRRASTLRNHAGQVAFPGGARDPGDDYPVGTALREAREETGLDPSGVTVLARLGSLAVPPSGFDVVPVIGSTREPAAVHVVDVGETARVSHVRLADLLDPRNRFHVQRSVLGGRVYRGPAFAVDGMVVWGFTAGLLTAMFDSAGWTLPWDTADVRDLDETLEKAGQR